VSGSLDCDGADFIRLIDEKLDPLRFVFERRQNERYRAVQSLRAFEQALDHCRHKAIAKEISSHSLLAMQVRY
jgi:hypothetical protein